MKKGFTCLVKSKPVKQEVSCCDTFPNGECSLFNSAYLGKFVIGHRSCMKCVDFFLTLGTYENKAAVTFGPILLHIIFLSSFLGSKELYV